MSEAELLMPLCTKYTQNIYKQTASACKGKSLAIEVTSEDVLQDMKNLIAIRASVRRAYTTS